MNQLLPRGAVDQIMREEQHFAAAPQAFFRGMEASGVEIAPAPDGSAAAFSSEPGQEQSGICANMLRLNDASAS